MKYVVFFITVLLIIPAFGSTALSQIEPAFPNLFFSRPIDIQNAGDGSDRIFVAEQDGIIYVFPNDPDVMEADMATFLDIESQVRRSGNEEGLLGMCFHPDYANNGQFFVNYSASNPRRNVISRFTVSSADSNAADPTSEEVLLEFNQPYSNHNGGQIAFGPDGYLYIATGDGGSGGDPDENGQDRTNLLGKILRIDVDNTDPGLAYSIPSDNPWAGNSDGYREEIYAYGLRNPWRFAFDPVTGWLWTGDVGQNRYEEVSIIEKGKNYGWDVMEGFHCFEPSNGCDQTGLELPIVEYGRSEGVSITGGHVYRGSNAPGYIGKYIYADFGSGRIWGVDYTPGETPDNQLIQNSGFNISTFGVDESGELYIAAFGRTIYWFEPTSTGIETGGYPIVPAAMPAGIQITSIHPNPVASSTGINLSFFLPSQAEVGIRIYDALGREVKNVSARSFGNGTHTSVIDGSGLLAGTYLVVIETPGSRASQYLVVSG